MKDQEGKLFYEFSLGAASESGACSGGLAIVPVRHLAQWPPLVLGYVLWPLSAPVVSFVPPPLLYL